MPATIVLGGQWGDEGKGKITDYLAVSANMVVRANGGSNAGHTVSTGEEVFKLHLVPSGILNSACACVIGAGVVIDPIALSSEITGLKERGIDTRHLLISERAHIVLPIHPEIDRLEEAARGTRQIGTTRKGIGPAYADKVSRVGIRMVDMLDVSSRDDLVDFLVSRWALRMGDAGDEITEAANGMAENLERAMEELRPYVGNAEIEVQDALDQGQHVVVEAAQGAMLDIDYGTYPFVTSSSPTAAGACQGAGIAPSQISEVVGVFKAYSTRVGEGPMPTELHDETSELIRQRGHEYGTTTGRPRRTGWFDATAARQVVRLNGISSIALTLLDVFDTFPTIGVCNGYDLAGKTIESVPASLIDLGAVDPLLEQREGWLEDTTGVRTRGDLPANAEAFVQTIEHNLNTSVRMIGVGPERDQLVR